MPAPAGALVVLLPIYLGLLGWIKVPVVATLIFTLAIAGLMVSRLPVFSGKRVGKRIPPEIVLPVIVVVVLFVALLIAYPWQVLSIGTVFYLAALPLGYLSFREYQRQDAAAAVAPVTAGRSRSDGAAAAAARPGSSGAAQLSARRNAPSTSWISPCPAPPAFRRPPTARTATWSTR